MKKIVILLFAILLVGGNTIAQKKNVSIAKARILSETPDTKAAKDAILLALKDPTTKDEASTWFMAGEVFYAMYSEQQKKQWVSKKGDQAIMAQSLKSALGYYTMADSLDQMPDEKGKIAPKFHSKIVSKVKDFQRGFTDAGSFYYEKKDYKNALNMFEIYLKYPSIKYMANLGLEKDTLIPTITYYCGLAATQAGNTKLAVKYYEIIKDKVDPKWVYSHLCDDYSALKDTQNLLRIYKLGAQKFPKDPFYMRSLINYYINKGLTAEALIWINHAIEQDPKNAALWNVKGRIMENDKKLDEAKTYFQKAIDLDPKNADALGNLGRIYFNHAVEELDRINKIRDDKKYRAEKLLLKKQFEIALPYFEKAYSINPNDRDCVIGLRGIYYNIGNDAKYQEMDAKIKQLK
ncbi:MAG: tetratricopeptide repeat protein [Bacteroidales bacterium]|nr:tetratricopeptide repeat protein [Bacteroidales bacterium]